MFVYRYYNIMTDQFEYVGVNFGNTINELMRRVYNHNYQDDWCKNGFYRIDYIEVINKSEAYALESHLISLYETFLRQNKDKSNYGINSLLPKHFEWIILRYVRDGKVVVVPELKIRQRQCKSNVKRVLEWLDKKSIGETFYIKEMLADLELSQQQLKTIKRGNLYIKNLLAKMRINQRKGLYQKI
ncbi:hypothetical protein [Ruminococcus sp. YE282]|uniref:hypothetical protein n=1 Tax=Ruminococcus sp. YE282 TaxID=3158780 RepID=UPI00088B12F0|nr:hypothetical protein SAMN02910441_00192 [Ruminococcus bromii]